MKHSIKVKLTLLIVAIVAAAILIGGLFTSLFLEKFYTNKKQNSIIKVYEQVKEATDSSVDFSVADNMKKLDNICEKSGATLIILDSGGNAVYAYGASDKLINRWIEMIYNPDVEELPSFEIIEQNDDYTIQSVEDNLSSNKHYELYGYLTTGNYFLIRMSVENFKESISITNTFYFWLSLAVLLITAIAIIFATRRYTKPLLELSDLSKRMSKLDFNAKYSGHHNDELGVLGESMNEMSETLEKTITELKSANVELHKDLAKREEIDEMRKDFISNVSHELKTPIALIQGYAEGLQEGITENPEDMEYYCDVIIDEANKMNKMVKNLLTLNQLEFGTSQVEIQRFDIVSVIAGVVESMKMRAASQNVVIRFDEKRNIDVWADEFQIEEVITNYLSNALNHVDENKQIEVKIFQKDAIVRVSVFNTGKQIPKEDLENIWVKFYKVDKARTREYGGNGIGLSIVKAIMDRHGKKCGVINHDNGVEFWFELDSQNISD